MPLILDTSWGSVWTLITFLAQWTGKVAPSATVAGGLGIKYKPAICRSSFLKGDALPLSAGPVVQRAENTEGVKGNCGSSPFPSTSLQS